MNIAIISRRPAVYGTDENTILLIAYNVENERFRQIVMEREQGMEFIVKGDPVGKQRPRFNGRTRTTYTPCKTKHYETLIRKAYEDTGGSMLDGYISLSLDVYFAIPKSYTKGKRLACEHNINRPDKKPDIDNILKIVLDGLNGVAYADDKQVIEVRCRKWYSQSTGFLKISVREVKA